MKDLKFLLILLFVLVIGLSVIFGVKLNMMEQNTKDRYLSTDFNIDLCKDSVQAVKEIIYRIEKADLVYKTELAKVRNLNNKYFDKLLKNIKEDARLNSWKERGRVDTLRVDINDLENCLFNKMTVNDVYKEKAQKMDTLTTYLILRKMDYKDQREELDKYTGFVMDAYFKGKIEMIDNVITLFCDITK